MKCVVPLLGSLGLSANAVTLNGGQSPIARVVGLIIELKAGVEKDGKTEQQEYDKYACWCENTLARKAKAINDAKDLIDKLGKEILGLKGDLGSHGAEIQQLNKDIEDNKRSTQEATEVRDKENDEFEAAKNQNEQCMGALEQAIKILTGAGTGKKGFLETMQEAQLLSVVGGVSKVLDTPLATHTLSAESIQTVQDFVSKPQAFIGSKSMSAAQTDQNPYGDYAPQSSAIQGILKGMYDAFAADIEKDNAEESDRQKAFEELMATKKEELATLEATLEKQSGDQATKRQREAESQTERDDTEAQLKADEDFFENTKDSCKQKAKEWSERSRLRTEELRGIEEAIQILQDPEAQSTFDASATTFVQVSKKASAHHRSKAFTRLRKLASKYRNVAMATLAAEVKTGGHFDKIMVMIDKMIADLRKEEQSDIAHRDRCQSSEGKNKNDMEDLTHDIEKHSEDIGRLEDKETELKATIQSLQDQIMETKNAMKEALDIRNEETATFKQALKDDTDAVKVIEMAIGALAKFYKKNKIPLGLMQNKQEPEYKVDEDQAPTTSFDSEGGAYGGRKGESGGIISIMEMIKEDTEKEMKTSTQDEEDSQLAFEKNRAKMRKTLEAQETSKTEGEKELSGTQGKIADTEEAKSSAAADLAEEQALEGTLDNDCAWVEQHFDSRREKRKTEIDGLVEAKNFLIGAGSDDDDDDLDLD